jgi:hypothetical protein
MMSATHVDAGAAGGAEFQSENRTFQTIATEAASGDVLPQRKRRITDRLRESGLLFPAGEDSEESEDTAEEEEEEEGEEEEEEGEEGDGSNGSDVGSAAADTPEHERRPLDPYQRGVMDGRAQAALLQKLRSPASTATSSQRLFDGGDISTDYIQKHCHIGSQADAARIIFSDCITKDHRTRLDVLRCTGPYRFCGVTCRVSQTSNADTHPTVIR